MRNRVYTPSETQIALHPPADSLMCRCGTKYVKRSVLEGSEDDPNLCLTCNRKKWSRLWNNNRPVEKNQDEVSFEIVGDVVPMRKRSQ